MADWVATRIDDCVSEENDHPSPVVNVTFFSPLLSALLCVRALLSSWPRDDDDQFHKHMGQTMSCTRLPRLCH